MVNLSHSPHSTQCVEENPRNSVSSILHKPRPMGKQGMFPRVDSRSKGQWGWDAKSKWPILLLVHPAEQAAYGLVKLLYQPVR